MLQTGRLPSSFFFSRVTVCTWRRRFFPFGVPLFGLASDLLFLGLLGISAFLGNSSGLLLAPLGCSPASPDHVWRLHATRSSAVNMSCTGGKKASGIFSRRCKRRSTTPFMSL